jgi:hypothetical protein
MEVNSQTSIEGYALSEIALCNALIDAKRRE